MPTSKFQTGLTITKEVLDLKNKNLRDAMIVNFVENSIECLKKTIDKENLEYNEINIAFITFLK